MVPIRHGTVRLEEMPREVLYLGQTGLRSLRRRLGMSVDCQPQRKREGERERERSPKGGLIARIRERKRDLFRLGLLGLGRLAA